MATDMEIDNFCDWCGQNASHCDCNYFEEGVCEWCGQDEMFCECGLDYCCFDPRYTGDRNICACKDHAELEQAQQSLSYKIKSWFTSKWYGLKQKVINWMPKPKSNNSDDLPF